MYHRYALFLKINLFISTLLFLAFLRFNSDVSAPMMLFDAAAAVSTAASLYLLLYLLLLPFSLFSRLILPLSAVIFVLVDLALIADFIIFRIWKFHINAMVLNIIFSPAAMDSIQAGVMPLLLTLGSIALLSVVQFVTIRWLQRQRLERVRDYNRHFVKGIAPLLFVVILAEKGIYGYANMYQHTALMESTKPIPLYQPMDYTGTAEELFNVKAPKKDEVRLHVKTTGSVNYPNVTLSYADAPRPHIFLIAFDSTRADMITPEVTPNAWELSKESWRFDNHVSGGNTTRFGIFGLFYALNSSLWFTFLNAEKRPVLFDALSHLGYDSHIFSSTDTRWPEFRQTVYFNLDGGISDNYEGKPWEKDRQSSRAFLKWLDEANASQPLFSFIFLDAPHGHSYPPDQGLFKPDADGDVNFVTVSESDREVLFNQYKNANHYDDALLGEMIAAIKAKGIYDDAIIILTSDHGDEFFEYGRFGHNTAYNRAQVGSPLLIKWPGNEPRVITKLTSALDIAPTLLRYLGVQNDPESYSHGRDLRDANYNRDYAYVGNWNDNGIVTPELTYVFSNLQLFNNEVRDTRTYKKTKRKDAKIDTILLEVLQQNRQFVK